MGFNNKRAGTLAGDGDSRGGVFDDSLQTGVSPADGGAFSDNLQAGTGVLQGSVFSEGEDRFSRGPQGPQGETGSAGPANSINTVVVFDETTTTFRLRFTYATGTATSGIINKTPGSQGSTGTDGDSVSIVSVTNGATLGTTSSIVFQVGTDVNTQTTLTIQPGVQGTEGTAGMDGGQGDPGIQGVPGADLSIVSVSSGNFPGETSTITLQIEGDPDSQETITIQPGLQGATGGIGGTGPRGFSGPINEVTDVQVINEDADSYQLRFVFQNGMEETGDIAKRAGSIGTDGIAVTDVAVVVGTTTPTGTELTIVTTLSDGNQTTSAVFTVPRGSDGIDGISGFTPVVSPKVAGAITISRQDGTTVDIADGLSPTVSAKMNGVVTITRADGTTEDIRDGTDGGADGFDFQTYAADANNINNGFIHPDGDNWGTDIRFEVNGVGYGVPSDATVTGSTLMIDVGIVDVGDCVEIFNVTTGTSAIVSEAQIISAIVNGDDDIIPLSKVAGIPDDPEFTDTVYVPSVNLGLLDAFPDTPDFENTQLDQAGLDALLATSTVDLGGAAVAEYPTVYTADFELTQGSFWTFSGDLFEWVSADQTVTISLLGPLMPDDTDATWTRRTQGNVPQVPQTQAEWDALAESSTIEFSGGTTEYPTVFTTEFTLTQGSFWTFGGDLFEWVSTEQVVTISLLGPLTPDDALATWTRRVEGNVVQTFTPTTPLQFNGNDVTSVAAGGNVRMHIDGEVLTIDDHQHEISYDEARTGTTPGSGNYTFLRGILGAADGLISTSLISDIKHLTVGRLGSSNVDNILDIERMSIGTVVEYNQSLSGVAFSFRVTEFATLVHANGARRIGIDIILGTIRDSAGTLNDAAIALDNIAFNVADPSFFEFTPDFGDQYTLSVHQDIAFEMYVADPNDDTAPNIERSRSGTVEPSIVAATNANVVRTGNQIVISEVGQGLLDDLEINDYIVIKPVNVPMNAVGILISKGTNQLNITMFSQFTDRSNGVIDHLVTTPDLLEDETDVDFSAFDAADLYLFAELAEVAGAVETVQVDTIIQARVEGSRYEVVSAGAGNPHIDVVMKDLILDDGASGDPAIIFRDPDTTDEDPFIHYDTSANEIAIRHSGTGVGSRIASAEDLPLGTVPTSWEGITGGADFVAVNTTIQVRSSADTIDIVTADGTQHVALTARALTLDDDVIGDPTLTFVDTDTTGEDPFIQYDTSENEITLRHSGAGAGSRIITAEELIGSPLLTQHELFGVTSSSTTLTDAAPINVALVSGQSFRITIRKAESVDQGLVEGSIITVGGLQFTLGSAFTSAVTTDTFSNSTSSGGDNALAVGSEWTLDTVIAATELSVSDSNVAVTVNANGRLVLTGAAGVTVPDATALVSGLQNTTQFSFVQDLIDNPAVAAVTGDALVTTIDEIVAQESLTSLNRVFINSATNVDEVADFPDITDTVLFPGSVQVLDGNGNPLYMNIYSLTNADEGNGIGNGFSGSYDDGGFANIQISSNSLGIPGVQPGDTQVAGYPAARFNTTPSMGETTAGIDGGVDVTNWWWAVNPNDLSQYFLLGPIDVSTNGNGHRARVRFIQGDAGSGWGNFANRRDNDLGIAQGWNNGWVIYRTDPNILQTNFALDSFTAGATYRFQPDAPGSSTFQWVQTPDVIVT